MRSDGFRGFFSFFFFDSSLSLSSGECIYSSSCLRIDLSV
jgi:hypothetical protein